MATLRIKSRPEGGSQYIVEKLELKVKEFSTGAYSVYSPEFNVLGYSTISKEDAEKDLFHSLDLFFKLHSESKTLETTLINLGFSKSRESIKLVPDSSDHFFQDVYQKLMMPGLSGRINSLIQRKSEAQSTEHEFMVYAG
jgi:hypothetical protein